VIEQLEREKDVLLKHYAAITPEALDSLTPEERHQLYKMFRLGVSVRTLTWRSVARSSGRRVCSLVTWT